MIIKTVCQQYELACRQNESGIQYFWFRLGKKDRFVAMVSFGMPRKSDVNVCIKKWDGVNIILNSKINMVTDPPFPPKNKKNAHAEPRKLRGEKHTQTKIKSYF